MQGVQEFECFSALPRGRALRDDIMGCEHTECACYGDVSD